jgi:hypothetical protein
MPEDVRLLREAGVLYCFASRQTKLLHVGFTLDTEDDVEKKHADLLERNWKDGGGNCLTWKRDGFTVATHVNMINMWNSNSTMWDFMKEHASFQIIRLGQVAVISNVMSLTRPIDIVKSTADGIFWHF